MPIELMTSFVTMVAMISRRSGWFGSRWPNFSTTSGGKYSASAETRYGSSGSDDSNTWSRSSRLAYARSTHSSGRVMPWPALIRSAMSSPDGSASSWRSSRFRASSSTMRSSNASIRRGEIADSWLRIWTWR